MSWLLLLALWCLTLVSGVLSQCNSNNEGQEVTDRCGRACFCENGRPVDCCRVRNDFTSMTGQERARYISTIKRARVDRRYRRKYDRIVSKHSKLFMSGIHQRAQFLPWHRYYMLEFEDLLQEIDCRVTLPYHDWSLFSGRPWETGSFWRGRPNGLNESIWSPSPRGLGGDGRGGCVRTGEFARGRWRMTRSANRRCITRRFNGRPPDIIAVQRLLRNRVRQFNRFELELRADLHDGFHCNVGGTMCNLKSAEAPEFFLHHCFVDKLWANWQELGDRYMNAYFNRNNRRLISTRYLSRNFLDNTYMIRRGRPAQCVLYNDPRHPEYGRVVDRLDQMSVRQMKRLPRHSFTPASRRQLRRLGIGRRERDRAQRLLRELQPSRPLTTERGMNRRDRALGFPLSSLRRSGRRRRMVQKKSNSMWERWQARHKKRPMVSVPFHSINATKF